jgi:hypothetical protein
VTTATKAPLLYSRCPLPMDGRRCDHPAVRTVAGVDVLLLDVEEMRHSVICEDDRGHTWTTSWSTAVVLT